MSFEESLSVDFAKSAHSTFGLIIASIDYLKSRLNQHLAPSMSLYDQVNLASINLKHQL